MRREIELLDSAVAKFRQEQPQMGLPEELFHFVSRSTPIVNVDLLIKDENGRGIQQELFANKGSFLAENQGLADVLVGLVTDYNAKITEKR